MEIRTILRRLSAGLNRTVDDATSAPLPPATQALIYWLRLRRPASLLLMLWPMLWGFLTSDAPSWAYLPIAIVFALTLRAASCLYVDLTDTGIEADDGPAEVPGQPSVFLLILLVAAVLGLGWLQGPLTLFLTLVWVVLVAAYPYMCKVTWFPQVYAGVVFGGMGTLLGQAAAGAFSLPVLFLFVAGTLWVAGVETLRADIRRAQDTESGLKSIVLVLGRMSVPFMGGCFLATLVMLVITGLLMGASPMFYIALLAAQGLLGHAYFGLRLNEEAAARRTYGRTGLAGALIAAAFLMGWF
jgi:4-hydroxybenzoate polyprenyltransferase